MDQSLVKIKKYLETQVENHSIYVWGARGQGANVITEAWIRAKEASSAGGANAATAIALWKKAVAAGYGELLKAFDCSGLVSAAMIYAGVADKRRDCDGIFALCKQISAVKNGALLFRVNKQNKSDETHVGFYFDGFQYHAKGRASGVVKEKYDASYWHKIAWYKSIPDTETAAATEAAAVDETVASEADNITPPYVLCKGRVYVRKMAGKPATDEEEVTHAPIYTTSKNEKLPFGEYDADTGWYGVETPQGAGFITNDKKYTKLVLE